MIPTWSEFCARPGVRKVDFNGKTLSVDVRGTLVHRSVFNALRDELLRDEWKDVGGGETKLDRRDWSYSIAGFNLATGKYFTAKQHTPAPWCRQLYRKTIYQWIERREGNTITVSPERPFCAVGDRLVRAMDVLRVNKARDHALRRGDHRRGCWT